MSNTTNKKSPSAQMKEKVHLVREGIKELFPDKSKQISNDHIHIILENYNCNVKSTVEAFCDGQAESLLTEWKKAGPKTSKANKKKKRKAIKKAAEQAALNAKLNKEAANPDEVKAEVPAAAPQEQTPAEEKEANLTSSSPIVEGENPAPSTMVPAAPMPSESPVTAVAPPSPKPTLPTAEEAKSAVVTIVKDRPFSDKHQGDVKKPTMKEPVSHSVAADVVVVNGAVSADVSKDDTAVSPAAAGKPKEKPSPKKAEQPVMSSAKITTTSAASQSPKKKPSAAKPPSGKAFASPNSADNNVPAPVAAQPPTKPSKKSRSRKSPVVSAVKTENDSAAARENKKAIEKGSRDLHRCAVSLKHYQAKVVEESDQSVREIQAAFKKMYTLLEDREVELMRKSDARRDYAKEFLSRRQSEGQRLKVRTDRVGQMSSAEVNELRAEIKHFVSERKHDELVARTARIVSPSVDEFKNFLQRLGEESAVKKPATTTETSTAEYHPSTTTVSKSSITTPDTPATPLPPPAAKTPVADDVFVASQPPPPPATTSPLNDDHGGNDKHQTDNNNNNDPPAHMLPVSPQKKRSPRSHHGRPRNLNINDGEKAHENGNGSDWADDAPMPPSPASWASEGGADHHHNSLLSNNNDDHANSSHESRRSSNKNHHSNHRKHSSNKQHQQDSEQMPPPKSTELMHRSSHRSNNNNAAAAPTRDRSHSNSRSRGRVGPPPPPHHHQHQQGGHYHHNHNNRANSNGPASGDAPDYHQHHQQPQRNGSYRGGRPDGRYQQQGRSRNTSYRGRGGGGQNRSNGGGSGGSYNNRRGSYNSSTGTFYRGTNGGGVGSDQQQRRRNYNSTHRQYDSSKSKAPGLATAEAVTAHD